MKILPVFILLVASISAAFAQNCLQSAKVIAPQISESARKIYETNLAQAKAEANANPQSADALVWLGRRTAYLGKYKEAIEIFTEGVAKFPKDARFLRHRGHRYITIRCFDDAINDLTKAFETIKRNGLKDEIEPDGLPNARNTPTSTLYTNVFYHLGLAYYLRGDFNLSAVVFMDCFNQSKNDDMRVAAAHWIYMGLRRSDKRVEADKFIKKQIKDNLDIIENDDYYKLIKLYQGKSKVEDLLKETAGKPDNLSSASLGYGLGNWYLYNGEKEKALKIFRQITGGNQWSSFGFIAAEVDLKRQN